MLDSPNAPTRLLDDPARLLLDMAQQRHVEDLLQLVVQRLGESPAVVLARIWLIRPGQGCETCLLRSECPDRTNCLHLVASAGRSLANPDERFTRIDGDFRRFPIGVRKVGRIAANSEPIEVSDLGSMPQWIARPDWVRAEGVRGFGGQPLVFRGEVLGVLAVFSRIAVGETCFNWLRMIADHAATALANARAWEEIARLQARLAEENEYLKDEVRAAAPMGEMVGRSPALEQVSRVIEMVAATGVSVIVLGETGTGKELVAREVHRRSALAERPFIKVNCAAIPRELFDSEFFGHVRGSFTGASRDRIGHFEMAHGGTLFLDEVGEIPLELQAKLLRAIATGEIQRVGEERTRKVDVRIVSATNRDLEAESKAGRFRADLFYRLHVVPVVLPPLRERLEDLPLLVEHIVERLSHRLGRPAPKITVGLLQQLSRYDWPGNIRELEHVLERALVTSAPGRIRVSLPVALGPPEARGTPSGEPDDILTDAELRAREADNLRRALRLTNGRIYGPGGAAERLGLKPTTLASRMKSLGIRTSVRIE